MLHARPYLALLIVLLLPACKQESEPIETHTSKATANLSAPSESSYQEAGHQKCQACHSAIAREWAGSMHGNSTLEKDPIFRLMFGKARAVLGDNVEVDCRTCHNPMWRPDTDTQLASAEGVTCVVCHQVAPKHPEVTLASGAIARLDPARAPTNVAQALCLSCHAERKTGKGVPICITGSENEHAGSAKCIDCHMASTPGPASMGSKKKDHRSHEFPGGHVASWVASAASLKLEVDKVKGEIVVTITPAALGHSLPTGSPMRHIVLELVAKNAKGEVVWESRPKGKGLLEPRESIFMRAFQNAEGKAPVPPFASSGQPSDNRLHSATPHALSYPIPKDASLVTASLLYHLAPKNVLDEAEVPPHWKEPVLMDRVELSSP